MTDDPRAWPDRLDPLDVVYCHFPEDGRLAPAPKPRPALVLNVNDETSPQRVEVAFGTSSKTTDKFAGEFELAPRDGRVFERAGLVEESKFHLGRRAWLPYNGRWFKPRPSVPAKTTPKLGKLDLALDESVRRRFVAAARAAGLLDPGQPPADDQAIRE